MEKSTRSEVIVRFEGGLGDCMLVASMISSRMEVDRVFLFWGAKGRGYAPYLGRQKYIVEDNI